MRYMMLIYSAHLPPEETPPDMVEAYNRFAHDVQTEGVFRAADRLQPADTATTVSVRKGKTTTTDGPFVETKEQLAGYFILECADLDDATAWAARLPGSWHGTVEVRPIMDM
jgi:hypothetical protein